MWAATFNLLEVCKAHTTPNTVRVYQVFVAFETKNIQIEWYSNHSDKEARA